MKNILIIFSQVLIFSIAVSAWANNFDSSKASYPDPSVLENFRVTTPPWADPDDPYWDADVFQLDDIIYRFPRTTGITQRSGFRANRWTDGIVYYIFNENVNETNQERFRLATELWSNVADLTFVEGTGSGNYIEVFDSDRNSSNVGMITGRQILNMFNWSNQIIIAHELGHSLGLLHEQSRSDRDTFVTIIEENIDPDSLFNFDIASTINYGEYDFESIMHYGPRFFIRSGLSADAVTIQVNPAFAEYQSIIGNRSSLSDLDKQGMATHYGLPRERPEIDVRGGLSLIPIPSGSTETEVANGTYVGNAEAGTSVSQSFRLFNQGSEVLNISSVTSSSPLFVVEGLGQSLNGPNSEPFTITFQPPTSTGVENSIITIENDDLDESTYTFSVSGFAGTPTAEIDVRVDGLSSTTGTQIENGDEEISQTKHTDLGSVLLRDDAVQLFQVYNTGTSNLVLSTPNRDDDFVVGGLDIFVAPGDFDEFFVRFAPTTEGVQTTTITLTTNDSDDNPFTFAVEGIGFRGPAPEIEVTDATGSFPIADGSVLITSLYDNDFGSHPVGSSSPNHSFRIFNKGNADLTLSGVVDSIDFSISGVPPVILPGDQADFTVVYTPTSVGEKTAQIRLDNNDTTENPFTFQVRGNGVLASPPAPVLFTVTQLDSAAELTWLAVADADSYSIYRGTSPSNIELLTTTTKTTLIDETIDVGGDFYYQVVANTAGGASPPISAIVETTGRPDIELRVQDRFRGNNLYNTLVGQTLQDRSRSLSQRRADVRIWNEGDVGTEQYFLFGTRGNRNFTVSYFSLGPRQNVTARVVTGRQVSEVTAGTRETYIVFSKPRSILRNRVGRNALIQRTRSIDDPTLRDISKTIFNKAR